jgi:uncharacterized membrane protein
VNVGPIERALSAAGGLAMLAFALARRSKASWPLALSGGYLLYRGISGHCVSYDLLGINRVAGDGQDSGILVEQAVTINQPRHKVYRFWRNLENLPRFMEHLESVRFTADRRSHWVSRGPLGTRVSWDAEIVEDRPDEHIAWASIPGSDLENSGWVHFADAPGGRGTEVTVSLTYNPPAGSTGAAVARLLGSDASTAVREDLRHFKQIMEAGETPTNDGQPSGRAMDGAHNGSQQHARGKDTVQIASEESFPASDPPSWTGAED